MISDNTLFQKRVALFQETANRNLLCCNLRGIERETLRVTADSELAQTAHPAKLGSALTHPEITTDYSEALLEFISSPMSRISDLEQQLDQIHRFTAQNLPEGEMLWPASMPVRLDADKDVPLAQYGQSNMGRMKTIYRNGLGLRYGRKMQTISGIHFNFSVPDAVWSLLRNTDDSLLSLQEYKTRAYMGLIRNFRRHFWLLIYLMGASPTVDKSFVKGREHNLQAAPHSNQDLWLPYATSLRMGDLGYQSAAQDDLYVCYNSVSTYVASLQHALLKAYPPYEKLGLKSGQASLQQLSTSVLQIENEFYSTIRPKQTTRPGETQLKALSERGIEYIEVRCVDCNPYEPLGISTAQIDILELFLLTMLFDESPMTTAEEYRTLLDNQRTIVERGREPGVKLRCYSDQLPMLDWSNELLIKMATVADIMDGLDNGTRYNSQIDWIRDCLQNPELTPSAQMLKQMSERGQSFIEWGQERAQTLTGQLKAQTLDLETQARYEDMATRSHQRQHNIEQEQSSSLEAYVEGYFDQYREL